MEYIDTDIIFDLETYPNIFTATFVKASGEDMVTFECSTRKNETKGLLDYLRACIKNKFRLVGFNNNGFDYPVLHEMLTEAVAYKLTKREYVITPDKMYQLAQSQIESFKGEFGHTIRTTEMFIPQLDLFKIHHFDNKAKSTSLKMLEFNMLSENIEDLPYAVGTYLTDSQMDNLIFYNKHDVHETRNFYLKSIPMIKFRDELSKKYNRDFTNHNDTKIGKDYFIMKLEDEGVECYSFKGGKRKINQSRRNIINLGECLFDYYDFVRPEFIAVKNWFAQQKITETKGVFTDIEEHDLGEVVNYAELTTRRQKLFKEPTEEVLAELKNKRPYSWIEVEELKALEDLKDSEGNVVYETVVDSKGKEKQKKIRVPKKSYWWNWRVATCLNVVIDGFRFDFSQGGLHGSVLNKIIEEDSEYEIWDWDVSSFYPNLAISNRFYPEHLGEVFCDIYEDVYNQRKSFAKGTPENAMLKLALNGTYGESNNAFSCFYDPKYTMITCINGQLSLSLIIDMWIREGLDFSMLMANTDGVTIKVNKKQLNLMQKVAEDWQNKLKLTLEKVQYKKMCIRDCNNYLSVYK